ncbi:peptidylprolyl isomerase [Falseniella ignava]|uniref:Peptidyl-prolyl cis-trans isomerase n=2 Tax=Falseniella ignava TaxID=137730 RepID=K1LUZ4_9LACT|nr:peptidylprolyl isomerase [Falseniella ignava]EKB53838.1 hypothetical protein HMPREF9707_01591 [Falseniella ignava CCUG 37419]PKY89631.1 peptidylprolyl isomerase [Falseniella ignava]
MSEYPQTQPEKLSTDVTIHTNMGDIEIALFEDAAPKAVNNFKSLAKEGYYDGVIFHRIIKDFMIQGGDPTGTGAGGESIYGNKFEDEFSENYYHLRGALSMANAGPNTNGSQFFIVTASQVPLSMLGQLEALNLPQVVVEAYGEVGGTPWLDSRHTVFGHVTKGMDIVEKIESVPTNPADRPIEDVIIESIDILE